MRVVKYILLSFYILLAFFVTLCLFASNSFGDASFGDITFLGLDQDISSYKRGSFLIAARDTASIEVGDEILYYDNANNKNEVQVSEVYKVMQGSEYTYEIHDGLFLSYDYVIGRVGDITSIPVLGYVFTFLTGKVGYFVFVLLPLLLCFCYQLKKYRKMGRVHEEN